MRIRSQDVSISVLVEDIEDSVLLGMDILSDVDAKIDLLQQQLVINGEAIGCCSNGCQQLSRRRVTRRIAVIETNSEVVIPVHFIHRQS